MTQKTFRSLLLPGVVISLLLFVGSMFAKGDRPIAAANSIGPVKIGKFLRRRASKYRFPRKGENTIVSTVSKRNNKGEVVRKVPFSSKYPESSRGKTKHKSPKRGEILGDILDVLGPDKDLKIPSKNANTTGQKAQTPNESILKKAKAEAGQGVHFLQMKRYPNAIQHLARAVELDPRYDKARYNLGLAYWESGELQKAKVQYSKLRDKKSSRAQKLKELLNSKSKP